MHHHLPDRGDYLLLFLASLLGASHCAAMCGPYVALCSAKLVPGRGTGVSRSALRGLFNLGRVSVYVLIGAVAGAFGQIGNALAVRAGFSGLVSVIAGLFGIAFALSIAGVLPEPERILAAAGLDRLVRAGALEAYRAPPYSGAFFLGSLQGLLPCSLVYGAAARAAAATSAFRGALTMLIFGLGTVPAIVLLTYGGRAVHLLARFRKGAAVFVGLVGVLLVLRGLAGWGILPHAAFW